jgi:hypothetical protein
MAKPEPHVVALAETLRSVIGADDNKAWDHVREYWARMPQRELESRPIGNPEDYKGEERLSISYNQVGLSATEKRKLAEKWSEALPRLTQVRWLYFNSNMPQELFQAACALPSLEGMYIKSSGITDLSPITQCKALRYLHIGSSANILSISPLATLTQLKWLQINSVKAATSLEPISSLTGLEGLGFTGAEFKSFKVESFAPLNRLTQLQWLHLGAVHTEDLSLRCLMGLKNLKFLGVGNFFPVEEFARLSLYFDKSVCEWAQPYVKSHSSVFPCRKCKKNWRVMISGEGSRLLCPTCDSLALALSQDCSTAGDRR